MSLNIELLRESFAKAVPVADKVADKFYEFLWTDYPQSKALFAKVDMDKQKVALIKSLAKIVEEVDQPENLVPYLEKMGARHIDYGTEPEHYDWVGASLLKTFAFFFEEEWTDELNQAWADAYGVIADVMQKGARDRLANEANQQNQAKKQSIDNVKQRARELCLNIVSNSLEECFDEEFEKLAREKVRQRLNEIFEAEAEEFFKKSA